MENPIRTHLAHFSWASVTLNLDGVEGKFGEGICIAVDVILSIVLF